MNDAWSRVVSFRMQSISAGGVKKSDTTVILKPLRIHQFTDNGLSIQEQYLVAGILYYSFGPTVWLKEHIASSAAFTDSEPSVIRAPDLTILPDVSEGGASYGAFSVRYSVVTKQPNAVTICTYDKLTSLFHACNDNGMVNTYSKWNDPAIAITVPADVLRRAIDFPSAPMPASPANR